MTPENFKSRHKIPAPDFSTSWENLLHETGAYDKPLLTKDIQEFKSKTGHRAIGDVYDPDYEFGNYAPGNIASRHEAFIFLMCSFKQASNTKMDINTRSVLSALVYFLAFSRRNTEPE